MYLMPVIFRPTDAGASPFSAGFLAAAVLCAPAQSQVSTEPGTAAMQAIALVPAARPAGVSGAYTALGSGTSSLGINPAGLARESGPTYSGSVRSGMVRAGSVVYAFPALQGRWAFGASYIDYNEVLETDENGAVHGTLRPFNLYPSVTYARPAGERWRWGATFKMARETLGEFEGAQPAYGAGVDAGVQYQPAVRNLGFGAAVTNVGRQFSGHFEGDDHRGFLPGAVRAGVFYQPRGERKVVLTADLEAPFYSAPLVAAGAEYRVISEWTLRAGTRWSRDDLRNLFGWIDPNSGIEERGGEAAKLAAGTSLQVGPVAVDYAAQWWRELGIMHALTVAWALNP